MGHLPIERSLSLILAAPALWLVGLLVRVVATRLTHPMDLEWMEGGMLYQATRIIHGLPLYPPPDEGYAPFPYPIAYPLLLALLGWITGVDYTVARFISITATAAATYLLARLVLVHHSGRHRWLVATLTVGGVAAGFPIVDGWYDLARVDALAASFVVAAACIASNSSLTPRGAITAGLLLTAGVLTKQSTAPLIVWIVVLAVVRHRKPGLWLAAVAAASFGLSLGALLLVTKGQYWFYTVTLLQNHQVRAHRVTEAYQTLSGFAPYAVGLPAIAALLAWRRRLSFRSFFWLGLTVISWGTGVVSFGKDGGYFNALLPAVWLTVPSALLLLKDILDAGQDTDLRWLVGWFSVGALSALLFTQIYPASNFVVTAEARARAEALDARIAALDQTLFAPLFPHLATRHGKGRHQLHAEVYNDFIWANRPFRDTFTKYLAKVNPDMVLLAGDEATADIVKHSYVIFEHLDPTRFDVTTRIGWNITPRLLLRRRPIRTREHVVFDFEADTLTGWTAQGLGLHPSARTQVRGQGRVRGVKGKRFLNSFHSGIGDKATGFAMSPPFLLDRAELGLLVGGGFHQETRVELLVDGAVTHTALGTNRSELEEVAWDISSLQGRTAQLRIVDEARGGWGHIMLDHVALYDPLPDSPPVQHP